MRPKIGDRVLITRGGLGTKETISQFREENIQLIGTRIQRLKYRPIKYYGIPFSETTNHTTFVKLQHTNIIIGLGRGHGLVSIGGIKLTKFNKYSKERLTYKEQLEPAMSIANQIDADQYLNDYVRYLRKTVPGDVREMAKVNLIYYAGYYDKETVERIEELFKIKYEGL